MIGLTKMTKYGQKWPWLSTRYTIYPDLLFQNNTNFPTIRMACKLGWLATVL